MESKIINFIQEDSHPINCLFEKELFVTRKYWYEHYNSDKNFCTIAEIMDERTEGLVNAAYGENSYNEMLPSFKYSEFLKFHKSMKHILEQDLAANDITLKNQMDFYLVEFFRNVNEAYRLHQLVVSAGKSSLYEEVSKLTSYIKAASDCFSLWSGSDIIQRGQIMGIRYVEKKEKEIRSKGGQGKSKKYAEANKLAIELHNSGKEIYEIAEALIAKKEEDHFFQMPTINTSNSGTRTLRKWIEKEKKKSKALTS